MQLCGKQCQCSFINYREVRQDDIASYDNGIIDYQTKDELSLGLKMVDLSK